MKDFKPMVKMQAGGAVNRIDLPGGMGVGQPSGPMGIAAQGKKFQPGRTPTPRVGYKQGKKVK